VERKGAGWRLGGGKGLRKWGSGLEGGGKDGHVKMKPLLSVWPGTKKKAVRSEGERFRESRFLRICPRVSKRRGGSLRRRE